MLVVGLDVGRESHRYLLLSGHSKEVLDEGSLPNKSWAFEAWAEEVESLDSDGVRLCLECGNGLSTPIEQFAQARGWGIVTLPPKAVKTYREEVMGQVNKTDRTDAHAIALLGSEELPAKRYACRAQPRVALRSYARERFRLSKEKTATKNRLRQAIAEFFPELDVKQVKDLETQPILWLLAHHPDPRQWAELGTEKLLQLMAAGRLPARRRRPEFLDRLVQLSQKFKQTMSDRDARFAIAEIGTLARRLQHMVEEIRDINWMLENLTSEDQHVNVVATLTGSGVFLSSLIMGEIQDISNFTSEAKLASYAGQAQKDCQTGKSYFYKRPQLKSNRRLKWALMQIALNNSRLDSRSRAYVKKKQTEGKTPLQSMRCLARQLTRVLFSMLKNSQPYRAAV